jgi:hypothetical protein
VDVDAEARADGLELEEHEEAVLEPRDAVGVTLAVAALLGAPAPGSISLVSSMGSCSSAVSWLAGWWGLSGWDRRCYTVALADEEFEI